MENTEEIKNGIGSAIATDTVNNQIINADTDENSNSKKKESTRTYIAQVYVWAFFAIILLVFITGWIRCFKVEDYKDLLIAVSGTLSGPLGFIVGYYFKASKE